MLLFFWVQTTFGQALEGFVYDRSSGMGLSYVNIGFIKRNIGTTSNENGYYQLNFKNVKNTDTLQVSMIGYKTQKFSVTELNWGKFNIYLKEESIQLKEIVINKPKLKTIRLGSKGVAGFMQTGWGGGTTGGERGLKISVKKPVVINELNFHIASNQYDSVLLRLHLRKFADKLPGEELLVQNIYIKVYNTEGWLKRDLSDYDIVLDNDVLLSLELLEFWGKCQPPGCFHLSMSVPGRTFFFKWYSFSQWEKRKGRNPSMYITVFVLD
jgi:carboxypeptidase-like protein